jgi:hypothetical protein
MSLAGSNEQPTRLPNSAGEALSGVETATAVSTDMPGRARAALASRGLKRMRTVKRRTILVPCSSYLRRRQRDRAECGGLRFPDLPRLFRAVRRLDLQADRRADHGQNRNRRHCYVPGGGLVADTTYITSRRASKNVSLRQDAA